MRRPGALVLAVCTLAIVFTAGAATETRPPRAAGYWAGTIEMPHGPLDVQIALDQGAAGWEGRIDIPMQGIHGLALEEISVAGQAVRFAMSGVAGDPRFSGHLAADGGSIAGTHSHGGRDFAFSLTRSDSPLADLGELFVGYVEPGIPGEGLAGEWRGLMEGGLAKLRVEMRIVEDDDGTLTGSMSSPDQGSGKMTIDSIAVENDKVTINVGTVYGAFEGYMIDDGATLVGQWLQNKVNFPISFRRQPGPGVNGN